MQDALTAWKAKKIQGYTDRNEGKILFFVTKAIYSPPTKGTVPLLSVDGSSRSLRRHKFYSDGSSTSEASSTVPPPSPTPPSPVCLKSRPTSTSTFRPLSTKPSGRCSSSPAGKRPDRTRCLPRSK
ncbi:hypothetical protein SprV_0501868500 [Sparganum proliferum]